MEKEIFRILPGKYKIIPNPFLAGEIIFLAQDEQRKLLFSANLERKEGNPQILHFKGVGEKDVYNVSPFFINGELYLAGRIESRENSDSESGFFRRENNDWALAEDLPRFRLEDPFVSLINGEIVFGGVQTWPLPNPEMLGFRTIFYRGDSLEDLHEFTRGPDFMKDIRLIELPDKKIGVFTRPQDETGEWKKIGFDTIEVLDQLTPKMISDAPLIDDQFEEGEWGGVNAAYLLESGQIGILGHVANLGRDLNYHYRAMAFTFDPFTRESSRMEIVASRKDFPPSVSKSPKLSDVVFPGGLVANGSLVILYTGLSDAVAGTRDIPNPF